MFTIGLDNGIRVADIEKKDMPHFIIYPFKENFGDSIDICYWRKCWNLRNSILSKICKPANKTFNCLYDLSIEDITAIRKELIWWFLHPKDWNHSDSIWTYSEIRTNLLRSIWNLGIISNWMYCHPEIRVYFYDSF